MSVERLSTESWSPPWIRYAHLCRYAWAAQRAPGKDVIDAACGTGYGTKTLAEAGARSVRAFDVSPEAVASASQMVRTEGVSFKQADITHLPLDKETCDLFVSFETIEHVTDDAAYLSEVGRVLRRDGVLLCSTPNRTITNPGTSLTDKPYNPFHVREYNRIELEALLRSRFQKVDWYGQGFFSSAWERALTSASRIQPRLAVRVHQVRKLLGVPWQHEKDFSPIPLLAGREPETLVAVCSTVKKVS